jgi:hypothetical protein
MVPVQSTAGPPSSSAGAALDADAGKPPLPAAAGNDTQAQQGHSSSGGVSHVSAVLERARSLGLGSHGAAAAAAAAAAAEAPADGSADEAAARTAGVASTSKGGAASVDHLKDGDRLLLRMPRRWQVCVRTLSVQGAYQVHALFTRSCSCLSAYQV